MQTRWPRFIYVHGFNSSPLSFKARQMQRWFTEQQIDAELLIPELPHWPDQAMALLRGLVEAADQVVLIGSSLGGFYSTWLSEHYPQARAVLVNPAVAPDRLISNLLGENQNLYTGERYQLTEAHVRQLQRWYCARLHHPERLLLMQQMGDETLDYREALAYYVDCAQIVQPGGNHGFEGFELMLPAILGFARGVLPAEAGQSLASQ